MKKICFFLLSVFVVIHSFAQTPDDDFLRGVAYMANDSNQLAIQNLSEALKDDRYNIVILLKQGEAYYNLNEFEKAIGDFQNANTIRNHVADLWLARCYARKGDVPNAIYWLEEHLVSDYRIPETQIKRDPAFDDLQMTDEWFLIWQKEWYTPEEVVLKEVQYYIDRNDADKALAILESAIANGMMNPDLFFMRGKIFLEKNHYAPAISDFTSAMNLDRNNTEYMQNRGLANLGAARYKDAVNDFTGVLRNHPEYFNIYLARAKAYAGMEDYNRAVQDVRLYLNYFGSDQAAIFQCGEYCFQQGDYINALKYFNINMQNDAENAAYYKARGKTYTMTRTYQYAIYDLTMSLDLDPSDGETWLYLGISMLATGDRIAACSDFEKAIRAGETKALKYMIDNNCQ